MLFVRLFDLRLFCLFPLPLGIWDGLRLVIIALPGLFSYIFFIASEIFDRLIMRCCSINSLYFNQIFIKLAGNQDMRKISANIEIGPERNIRFGVTAPRRVNNLPLDWKCCSTDNDFSFLSEVDWTC